MTMLATSRQLDRDIRSVVDLLRKNETPEYIATEFMIASGLRHAVRRGGKLDRVLRRVEQAIAKDGFEWWQATPELRDVVDSVRASVKHVPDGEAEAVIRSLLNDDDPTVVQHVHVD